MTGRTIKLSVLGLELYVSTRTSPEVLAAVDAACEHWQTQRAEFEHVEVAQTRREAETNLGCGNTPATTRPMIQGTLPNDHKELREAGTLVGTCAGTRIHTAGGWRRLRE